MMKPKRQKPTENRSIDQVWQRALENRGPEQIMERVKEGVAVAQEAVDLPPFSHTLPASSPRNAPDNLFPVAAQPPSIWLERLEDLVMRDGWPVPLTRFYLIHHDRLLFLLDGLRASLYESSHGLPHPLHPYSPGLNPGLVKPFAHPPAYRSGQRH